VGLLFVAVALAPVSTAFADPALPGTITGYVRDGHGVGIAGVPVMADGDTSSTVMTSFMQRAVTKADGLFVITDVIQGTYRLTVNAPWEIGADPAYSEAYPWWGWPGDDPDHRGVVVGGATSNVGDVVLRDNGVVRGRAMRGTTPVAGSTVIANITDGDATYDRYAVTGADGRFVIEGAPAGEWSLTFRGSGADVPVDSVFGGWGGESDSLTQSPPMTFTLADGQDLALSDQPFVLGQMVTVHAYETFGTPANSYNVSDIRVLMTPVGGDEWSSFSWATGPDGWVDVYMPPGDYTMSISDPGGPDSEVSDPSVYETADLGAVTITGGAAAQTFQQMLAPKAGTRAITGLITEAGTGTKLQTKLTAALVDPSGYTNPFRYLETNGPGDGRYLLRVPNLTGYTGNAVKLDWIDFPPYVHLPATRTFGAVAAGTTQTLWNVTMTKGGAISGTVRDESGTPVPGVQVSAVHRAYSPEWGKVVWTGTDSSGAGIWYATTDSDGHYTIGGLPAGADWKVNYRSYFDLGMTLPEKYGDYYFRTYQGKPLVDPWDPAITALHTPVSVALGATTTGIDEVISPGGYVGLHADGPDEPTGAVWCDVWYNVAGSWIEVDSGYTTGGTFQKLWKVLPTGSYRLDYTDFFGRGSGSWSFSLAAGETKYTSVLVPAPLTDSVDATVGASFAGLIDGGLELGGTGGAQLDVDPLSDLPAGAPLPPSGMLLYANSVFDFTLSGSDVAGVWTLTMPYDPSIPDSVAPNIRVWHVKAGGAGELLAPVAWNTVNHTVMVQTSSLSPFKVIYSKAKVALGAPSTLGSLKANRTFTAYGSLKPRHTASRSGAQVKVYKQNSHHRWALYKTFTARTYNYSSYSRYSASVKLARGTYRFYGYSKADSWHLATTSLYRTVKVK
jgi:hypothetical protein